MESSAKLNLTFFLLSSNVTGSDCAVTKKLKGLSLM